MNAMRMAWCSAAVAVAACAQGGVNDTPPGPAGAAITLWTDSTELFMEHPALIVGAAGTFAVHLTDLTDFAPLRSGRITLRFEPQGGGTPLIVKQETPRAPGIYGPAPEFTAPGLYDLTLLVDSPQARDSITIRGLRVYATIAEAPVDSGGADAGISFLKEQQWKIAEFRTAFAVAGSLPATIESPAQLLPAARGHADISAPVAGSIDVAFAASAPVAGTRVTAGQVLAMVVPSLGESGSPVAEARARLADAEAELARAARLLAVEAVPARRVQEAEIRLRAAHEALAGVGGEGGQVAIRAPINGVVTARHFVPGGRVASGATLFTIVDPAQIWASVAVPAADATRIGAGSSASIRAEGSSTWLEAARLVSVGVVIDSVTRTVPVVYELANGDGRLRVGALARASIRTGERVAGIVVLETAVLENDGRNVVFVQVDGETFERREVVIRARDAGRVVLEGAIRPGERIVTGAAYQIRLASLSTGAPAQGHVH